MRYKRWQYESRPFTPIHDWVLDCSAASQWGSFYWGELQWDGAICADQRMGWLPKFPDFATRKFARPHLEGGAFHGLFAFPNFPVSGIGWLPDYPAFARANRRRPHLVGGSTEAYRLWLATSDADFSQSWLSHYPDKIYRDKIHPARVGGYTHLGNILPPLTDQAQFPCLYQRQPDFAKKNRAQPQYYQSFTWREGTTFGIWVEPGVTPTAAGSWTEPGTAPVTSSWTEPGVAPVTSTWTEPAVTPIVPSPDRTT